MQLCPRGAHLCPCPCSTGSPCQPVAVIPTKPQEWLQRFISDYKKEPTEQKKTKPTSLPAHSHVPVVCFFPTHSEIKAHPPRCLPWGDAGLKPSSCTKPCSCSKFVPLWQQLGAQGSTCGRADTGTGTAGMRKALHLIAGGHKTLPALLVAKPLPDGPEQRQVEVQARIWPSGSSVGFVHPPERQLSSG